MTEIKNLKQDKEEHFGFHGKCQPSNANSKEALEDLLNQLSFIDEWSANNIHSTIESICESRSIGFGKVGQPFRLALSGDGKSGSIDKSAQFVGKERTLNRLKMAINWISIQNN